MTRRRMADGKGEVIELSDCDRDRRPTAVGVSRRESGLYRIAVDTYSGPFFGCVGGFKAISNAGPQLGFIIPLTTETQGYLNLKSYWEFANQNRPAG